MKKQLLILLASLISISAWCQTYNPSESTASNKSYGMAQYGATDGRSMFYDNVNFKYRPFVSTAEVLSYLNLSKYRGGNFDIIINVGGSLSGGVITGGVNSVWWFRSGTADADLVLKVPITSVNGQTYGAIVTKSADSLKGQPIDTSVRRNGYMVTYDSVARKYYLAPGGVGTVYTGSSTIDVTGTVISALNTAALWNASQLRGRSITTNAPAQYQVLQWTGTEFGFANAGPSNALFTNDTIYIVRTPGDTIKLGAFASINYVDSIVATIPLNPDVEHDLTLLGVGSPADVLKVDTINYIATVAQFNFLDNRIDSINITPSGLDTVAHDLTLTGRGTLGVPLKSDTSVMATQSWVATNYVAPDGSETKVTAGSGISVAGNGTIATPYVVTAVGSPTSNPFKALTIESYGGVADATVPVSGSNANGTNNTTALNNMWTAAADGQLCIVPSGSWLFSTVPNQWQNKRMNTLILGTTYHNGVNFIRIVPPSPSGQDRFHIFRHMGRMIGRVNMPSHTKTTHDNGTAPVWSTFTGAAVTITDNDANQVFLNEVEGFYTAIDVVGSADGSQENTFTFERLYKNAVGITLRSTTGASFCDKNAFSGPEGGTGRISGGLAIKFDGYEPSGYNASFLSNHFDNVLIEQVDSAVIANGDLRETDFNALVVEAGVTKGIFGTIGIQLNVNGSNYARGTVFTNCSFMCTQWMNNMGINSTITNTGIWLNCSSFIGSDGYTDGSGVITIYTASNITQATRAALPAGWKTVNKLESPTEVSISAGTYTVAAGVYTVNSSNTIPTITLPTAASWPQREIYIRNTATSGSITISGAASGSTATIYPGKVMGYRCTGAIWYSLDPGGIANAGTIAGYVLTNTTGVANSASWQQNHGDWTYVNGTSSSNISSILVTIPITTGVGAEVETILVGYYGTGDDNYTIHQLQSITKKSGVLTFKGATQTVHSFTSDFTPASPVGVAISGNNFQVRVCSVASEQIQWTCAYRVVNTITLE